MTRPKPGDLNVCIRCAHMMLFNDDLTMRELTPIERSTALADPKVAQIRLAILLTAALHPVKPQKPN